MQHITLVVVGKLDAVFVPVFDLYAKRLTPLCRFHVRELPEVRLPANGASAADVAAALRREGEAILSALPKAASVAALCVEGRRYSSEGFAQLLAATAQSAKPHLALVIGSSHGLSPSVKAGADVCLSLSAMTLPHQLARVVLAEQLYRGYSILNHTKYHK